MYYFHLCDRDVIQDVDGTELADVDEARAHADVVASELKFKSDTFMDKAWSRWRMHVQDEDGAELFSFPMADAENEHNR